VAQPLDIPQRTNAWLEAGIIDAAQAERIVDFERGSAQPGGERVAGALGSLGGILLGLGVLLLVAANWDGLGSTAKLLMLLVAMVVAHLVAVRADVRGAPQWVGTAGHTVGTLVFGGAVFLLGQTFNVKAHDPLGFLVLALAATATAVLAGRQLIGWISAAAWGAWGMHEFVLSLSSSDSEEAAIAIIGAGLLLALAVLTVGWLVETHRDFGVLGVPYRSLAMAALLAVLVPISFAWRFDTGTRIVDATTQVIVVLAIALVAAALLALRGRVRRSRLLGASIVAAALLVTLAVLVQDALVAGLVANAMLVAGGFGLAAIGLIDEERETYAWGVLWVIAFVAARYIDVLVELDLGGLAFIGGGLLLLGCAWLVGRSRRLWKEHEA
jgi:uncharacterized membrane protein